MPPIVPPIKCQGIKTKLVKSIHALSKGRFRGRWIEPFCGSCVVPMNVRPERALLCDTNEHIIRFYSDVQAGKVTSGDARDYLEENGARLKRLGEEVFYEIRDGFNRSPNSLAFLFLNRSCFNGVMRFNRKGKFNVPFCRKPERFAKAYISKIANQISGCSTMLKSVDWEFRVSDFRQTLLTAAPGDMVYADPPYAGRHVDYYNSWSDRDESDLTAALKTSRANFVLSTWYQNKYRKNETVDSNWQGSKYSINHQEHFYHVGSSEDLRNSMTEALISNFAATIKPKLLVSVPTLLDALEM